MADTKPKMFKPQLGQQVTCLVAKEARPAGSATREKQEFRPGMVGTVAGVDIAYVYELRPGHTRECGHRCAYFANIDFSGDDGAKWRVALDYHNIAPIAEAAPNNKKAAVAPAWCADEESVYRLLEKRRWDECEQHEDAMRGMARLIVAGWPQMRFSSAHASEVADPRRGQCHVEVSLRLGKADAEAVQAFVAECRAAGWQEIRRYDKRDIVLSGAVGVRLPDGSCPAREGERRYAIVERKTGSDMFGVYATAQIVGRPHLKFTRPTLQNQL